MEVALLWLINEKDEVLLARRASHDGLDGGTWGLSISETVEPGESYENALVRGAREELGIDIGKLALTHLHDEMHGHKDGQGRTFGFFYARTIGDIIDNMQLEPTEVAEIQWISLEDLQAQYRNHAESIIIADDTELWRNIFVNLASALQPQQA